VTASLTWSGVYSAMLSPARARAQRTTPRAWPTRMALRRLLAKKSCSTAAASGRWARMYAPSWVSRWASRAASERAESVSIHAACTRRRLPGSPATTATPVRATPGSTPRTRTQRSLISSRHRLEDFVRDLRVGVHLLHVVVLLESLEQPDHGRRLLGVELHRRAGVHRHLGRGD